MRLKSTIFRFPVLGHSFDHPFSPDLSHITGTFELPKARTGAAAAAPQAGHLLVGTGAPQSQWSLSVEGAAPARYSGPRSARQRRATTRQIRTYSSLGRCAEFASFILPFFPCLAVELLPPRLKLAIFWTVPARYKWATLRAAASCHDPQEVMAPAVADPQALGLAKLYSLMLDHVNL